MADVLDIALLEHMLHGILEVLAMFPSFGVT